MKQRQPITTEALLVWAFERERAVFEWDRQGALSSISATARACRVLEEGALVQGHYSGGSGTASDALVVCSIVQSIGRGAAELLRRWAVAGARPDWFPRPGFRWVPCGMHRDGRSAATVTLGTVSWHDGRRRRKSDVQVCPVMLQPEPSRVASAREEWYRWAGALNRVAGILRKSQPLDRFEVMMAPVDEVPWSREAPFPGAFSQVSGLTSTGPVGGWKAVAVAGPAAPDRKRRPR